MTTEHPPAGAQTPAGNQPPAWQPPPQGQQPVPPPGGGYQPGPAAPDNVAAAKSMAARLPLPGWTLLGGALVAIVASFLPFFTVGVTGLLTVDVGMKGAFRVIVFLLVAAVVA